MISMGSNTTCSAWLGEYRCWGYGNGADNTSNTVPPTTAWDLGGNLNFFNVISGYDHHCAISTEGKVFYYDRKLSFSLKHLEKMNHLSIHISTERMVLSLSFMLGTLLGIE